MLIKDDSDPVDTNSPNIQRETVLNDLEGRMLLEQTATDVGTDGTWVDIKVVIPQNDDRTIMLISE